MNDAISRQAAIKAFEELPNCSNGYSDTYDKAYIIGTLEELPSAEPEENCDTCKYGYWGSEKCDSCRVGYPSNYERREDGD